MADKLISELGAMGVAVAANDIVELEDVSIGAPSKKVTVTELTLIEATARTAQDDIIEASSGLAGDGSLAAPAWAIITAAALTAQGEGITLKAFIHLLDTALNAVSTVDILTATVQMSRADILALHINPKTLIAAPGVSKMIEVISMCAYMNNDGTAYAIGAGEDMRARYDGANDLLEFSRNFIQYVGCVKHRGTWYSNVVMSSNEAIEMYATNQITNNGGTITVYITYRLITHADCVPAP